ncbi:hypothetical protein EXS62_03155 [Candidatus Kaiserbacteria bacterium]|nr:hypothetical protein [Candidatus Kaiserbacteria bacterium]
MVTKCTNGTEALVNCLAQYVINPLLLLLFAIGMLVFVYGTVEFMAGLSELNDKKEEGKKHMLWGLVGMFVMAAAYAIVKLIANTVGTNIPLR